MQNLSFMNPGVYSDRQLRELIKEGVIIARKSMYNSSDTLFDKAQIQPASVDLRLGDGTCSEKENENLYLHCLKSSSLPPKGNLEEYFSKRNKYFVPFIATKIYLHKNEVYASPLLEELNLPDYLMAKANPKSTSGRIDLHVRCLTEAGSPFDTVPAGYHGKLWLEMFPRSFDIEITERDRFSQIRIMDAETQSLSPEHLIELHEKEGILFNKKSKLTTKDFEKHLIGNFITLGIGLRTKNKGYIAKKNTGSVHTYKKYHNEDYFDSIKLDNVDEIIINPGDFCILSSYERVNIPINVCAEMVDIDTGLGEFRSHYAGFFDPGFNANATLEVRNLGAPFSLFHKQFVAGLKFYPMKSIPDNFYGFANNYQGQKGPKLAKYFF
ncbi:MAG: 2'-deoxycytidine 5'-triphosphate deaminase domain-containing protein [Nanoarchaeota archaeon]